MLLEEINRDLCEAHFGPASLKIVVLDHERVFGPAELLQLPVLGFGFFQERCV
jgi:hypothetical protein